MFSLGKIIITALTFLLLISGGSIKGQVVVVASKNLSVKSIDLVTLVNLYTLRAGEIGAEKVHILFNNSESEASEKFLRAIGKSLIELKKIWLRARLTNNGFPPQTVSSDSEMINKINGSMNTIGFADLKSVPKDVKILLKID